MPPLRPTTGSATGSRRLRVAGRAAVLASLAAAAVSGASLHAQTLPPQISLEGGLTATDNGGLAPPGQERADLITTVRPRFTFWRRGPRLELDLAASASLVAYANGTQSTAVLPELRGLVRSELVERLLYVDGAADVGQVEVSSFGARVDELTGANRQTASSFRVSPYLLRDLSATSFVLARHDLATTHNGSDTGARLLSNRTVLRYEAKPVPVGTAFELSRLDNDTSGSDDGRLTLDAARASVSVALRNQMILGAVAGADRSDFADRRHTDPVYGLTLLWNPGPRTSLEAALEHRFFGAGGSFVFRHRMPFMSFVVSMRRGPATVSSTLGQIDAGSDLRPFLDAILTTRYPDAAVRRGLVQSIVGTRGLDIRLPNPTDIVAAYPQLQTRANATWAFLGTRNTASLTVYTQTLRELRHDGDPPPSSLAQEDNRQWGASLQVGRRLTPQLSVQAVLRWSRIEGLAARAGESSEEWVQRLVISRAVSARTGISAGLQHNRFASTARDQNDYRATLAFVGLRHTF